MHKALIRATAKTPVNDGMLDACMTTSDSLLGPFGTWRDSTTISQCNSIRHFVKNNNGIDWKIQIKTFKYISFYLTSTATLIDEMISQVTTTTVGDFSRKSTGQTRIGELNRRTMALLLGIDIGSRTIKASIFEGSFSNTNYKALVVQAKQNQAALVGQTTNRASWFIKISGQNQQVKLEWFPCKDLSTKSDGSIHQ